MENRCEVISRHLLPLFRSSVAKELIVTHELTQVQASEILGTTQAAISQYVHFKRAVKGVNKFVDISPKIQKMALQTAEQLVKKQTTWKEVSSSFCKICSSILDEDTANKVGDNYNI